MLIRKKSFTFTEMLVFGIGVMLMASLMFVVFMGMKEEKDRKSKGNPRVVTEIDGVKLYEYYNGQKTIYFTNKGESWWQEHYGKGQVRDVKVN